MTPAPDVRTWFALTEDDRQAAYRIRLAVFVEEQRVPPEEEKDELDGIALHLLAATPVEVVGTSRLVVLDDGTGIVGRVAVLPGWRRQGIASRMLQEIEERARFLGLHSLQLNSQSYVIELYTRHGYAIAGGPFLDAGIEHVPMRKAL